MSVISIVIPALDEAAGIGKTITAIPRREIGQMGYTVQVLVVDNGSLDGTAQIAKKQGAEIVFEPERGYGSAYQTGFAHAKGEIIVTADADCTYPMEEIPRLLKILIDENLEFLTTNRFYSLADGIMAHGNRAGNWVLNTITKLLFQIRLEDTQSGMWLFRRDILNNMVLRTKKMQFSEEIKLEACYFNKVRWREVPITYRRRVGNRKLRLWIEGLQNLWYLFRKRCIR